MESLLKDGGLGVMCLPDSASLSPYLRNFLTQNFNSVEDLEATPSLLAQLKRELDRDNEEFRRVEAEVLATSVRGVSSYDHLIKILRRLASEIEDAQASTAPLSSGENYVGHDSGSGGDVADELDGEEVSDWVGLGRLEIESIMNSGIAKKVDDNVFFDQQAMVRELEALASEVARVERVRIYAESVLKLEQLVGDLEASVALISGSSSKVGNAASSLRITLAVQIMQRTEDAVAEIAHAGWNCLVSAVDRRLDRVASILRPAAIADHRAVLTSIGWPPQLSAASGGGTKLANPFDELSEDEERQYCESMMALTILQAVQQGRRERQHQGIGTPRGTGVRRNGMSARARLCAVEELITPLASKAEHHFVKWSTKPELVFALAYRIAQAYVDVIDEILQPWIDKAKLVGYSAREELIFSLVDMVAEYLKTHVLPGLANDLQDEGGIGSVGAALWLHIVDQALAFDSRMKSLAMRGLGPFEGDESQETENLSGPISLSISAIAEREDWLVLWANLELKEVLEKLKAELQTEAAWTVRAKSPSIPGLVEGMSQVPTVPLNARVEEFRAPSGADFVLSSMSSVADRCRNLSDPDQQYKFIKQAVMPIGREYYQELSRRCEEVQAVTSLSDETSMVTISTCVNAASFCAQELKDWGEHIFFLEIFQVQQVCSDDWTDLDGSIFDEEIRNFEQFRQEWLEKLVLSISREFEARSREYLRNKKRWIEDPKSNVEVEYFSKLNEVNHSEELTYRQKEFLDENQANIFKIYDVSPSLVEALTVLQSHLRTLEATLDKLNFFELWRSIAMALDELLLNSVLLSGAKFSEHGGWQFAADMQALFLLFKDYCVRPSGFFKALQDAVRLLTLPCKDAASAIDSLGNLEMLKFQKDLPGGGNVELKQYGVRKLPLSTAKKILSCRVLPKP